MTAIKREEIIGDCRLILGDNMPIMADMAENEFQLAIVDPEYGININMNMGRRKGEPKKHKEKGWDKKPPEDSYFDELFRLSQFQIIWGGNYFNLPLTKSWIFWDKLVPAGVSFADGELAWTSGDKTLRKCTVPYSGFVGTDKDGRIHPTQKPVALYRWVLKNYAKKGDHILDTHAGSFSSVIACLEMGFKITAIEIDEDYFNAGVERVRRYQRQGKLFSPPKQQPKPQGLF